MVGVEGHGEGRPQRSNRHTDAQLREERYNLLNSYLATVPANHALNVRRMLITNANYAEALRDSATFCTCPLFS